MTEIIIKEVSSLSELRAESNLKLRLSLGQYKQCRILIANFLVSCQSNWLPPPPPPPPVSWVEMVARVVAVIVVVVC